MLILRETLGTEIVFYYMLILSPRHEWIATWNHANFLFLQVHIIKFLYVRCGEEKIINLNKATTYDQKLISRVLFPKL